MGEGGHPLVAYRCTRGWGREHRSLLCDLCARRGKSTTGSRLFLNPTMPPFPHNVVVCPRGVPSCCCCFVLLSRAGR